MDPGFGKTKAGSLQLSPRLVAVVLPVVSASRFGTQTTVVAEEK